MSLAVALPLQEAAGTGKVQAVGSTVEIADIANVVVFVKYQDE